MVRRVIGQGLERHPALGRQPVAVNLHPGKALAKVDDQPRKTFVLQQQVAAIAQKQYRDVQRLGCAPGQGRLLGVFHFQKIPRRAAGPYAQQRLERHLLPDALRAQRIPGKLMINRHMALHIS